jgi:hypothetical protein
MSADLVALAQWRGADGVAFGSSSGSCSIGLASRPGRRSNPSARADECAKGDRRQAAPEARTWATTIVHEHRVVRSFGATLVAVLTPPPTAKNICALQVVALLAFHFAPAEALHALGCKLAGTPLDGAASTLTRAFRALAALPPDERLRNLANASPGSVGARLVATLRLLAAHLCECEPRPVAHLWHVPAAEAARLGASGTRLPLGAVVSLVEALALRITLAIEHADGTIARHHLGPDDGADGLSGGGLLVRDGHASAVLCGPPAPRQVRRRRRRRAAG